MEAATHGEGELSNDWRRDCCCCHTSRCRRSDACVCRAATALTPDGDGDPSKPEDGVDPAVGGEEEDTCGVRSESSETGVRAGVTPSSAAPANRSPLLPRTFDSHSPLGVAPTAVYAEVAAAVALPATSPYTTSLSAAVPAEEARNRRSRSSGKDGDDNDDNGDDAALFLR